MLPMSRPSVNGWSSGWRLLTGYGLALLATFAAVLIRRALDPVLGNSVPYISVFPAVIFSAWYCGIGPSLMSAAIALVAETYLYASPGPHGTVSAFGVGVQVAMYVLVCAIVIMIAENNRRTIGRLNAANATLETRVQERT